MLTTYKNRTEFLSALSAHMVGANAAVDARAALLEGFSTADDWTLFWPEPLTFSADKVSLNLARET